MAEAVCLTLVLAVSVAAQSPGAKPQPSNANPLGQPTNPSATGGAPVQLEGRTVVEIRWGYKTFTPASRAARISSELKRLGADPSAPRLSLAPESATIDVMSGDTLIAAVFDGDATAAGLTKEDLAQQWLSAMQQAVDRYHAEHSLRLRLIRLGLALLTVVVCLALLVLLRELTRRLVRSATAKLDQSTARADRRLALFLAHEKTHTLITRGAAFLRLVLSLIVLWFGLHQLLYIFPSTRPLAQRMSESVLNPVQAFGSALLDSLPSLVFIVLLAVVTRYVVRVVHFFFRKVADGEITLEGFRPIWAPATDRLLTIALVILALLVAYPYIPGSESPAFKGISLFLGVLVSLGSTGVVANAVTGVSLTYVDAFEIGDLVQIGDVLGYVTKMGMLTTRVRTRKNEIITIPNSVVTSKEIINFNKPGDQGVIISSKVGIGYDTPWRQVEGMLKLAASRTHGVRAVPEPFVLELSLNTFDISYEINAHLEAGQLPYIVLAELNRKILDAFNEFGVQIMTPAYMADPQHDKIVPQDRWHQPPAEPLKPPDVRPDDSKAAD
jgi:small-conductance mechanosensitive channel